MSLKVMPALREGYLEPMQAKRPYTVVKEFFQSKAALPNPTLRALADKYRHNNFGNAPFVSELRIAGREAYLFSCHHGLGNPASVFILDRQGREIPSR